MASPDPPQPLTLAGGAWDQLRASLPRGGSLTETVWRKRHRMILWVLLGHVPLVFLVALNAGASPAVALLCAGVVACSAWLASLPTSRLLRAMLGSAGLLACSGILNYISGGLLPFQLHFFVSLALVSLYQEWLPFILSCLYVVLHHGVIGTIDPTSVYHNPEAIAHPWRWAIIHSGFVAAACGAYVMQWRLTEDLRDDAQTLLDSAGEGVLGLDLSAQVVFANPAASAILGRPREKLIGRHVIELFQGLAVPRGGTPATRHVVEATLRQENPVPVECILTPTVRRGAMQGHVVTFRDITERRRAEAERLDAQQDKLRRLQEIDEMKTQFLNNAAHELRTPLTPLALQVEALEVRLHRQGSPPEDKRAAELLRRNFERLQGLIEDVVSVSRLDAGRVKLRIQRIDLAHALSEVREAFAPLARRQGLAFIVSCPAGLTVDADPLRLNQILTNLVANALRYTPEGSVTVEARSDGDMVVLDVSDTGLGLSDEQMGRLFQPFGQVHDGVAAERVGTGLGLYITRALVDLHGGSVAVRSEGPTRGSTFTVRLPAVCAGPAPVVAEPAGIAA